MNTIQLVGQVITSTNYTAQKLFDFNPKPIREAAEHFLACGVSEIEIPEGVLDPNRRNTETCLDEETLKQAIEGLPGEVKVVASYLGGPLLGKDNAAYIEEKKTIITHLINYCPDVKYAMLHPARKDAGDVENIRGIVDAYAQLAEYAASLRDGFQLCFHNHYDTNGESAEQVRAYLDAIAEADLPSLRWGPDTGHCHGMGDEYLDMLSEYAHMVGDYFHIKARVPAFDRLHGGEAYRKDRDIWSNQAEIGGGLYSGFVNVADPEIVTPFKEVFKIIREKARPTDGVVRGAMEIDIPRQHPRLETLCGVLYLKNVHDIQGAIELSNDEIIARVFA